MKLAAISRRTRADGIGPMTSEPYKAAASLATDQRRPVRETVPRDGRRSPRGVPRPDRRPAGPAPCATRRLPDRLEHRRKARAGTCRRHALMRSPRRPDRRENGLSHHRHGRRARVLGEGYAAAVWRPQPTRPVHGLGIRPVKSGIFGPHIIRAAASAAHRGTSSRCPRRGPSPSGRVATCCRSGSGAARPRECGGIWNQRYHNVVVVCVCVCGGGLVVCVCGWVFFLAMVALVCFVCWWPCPRHSLTCLLDQSAPQDTWCGGAIGE